MKTAFVRTLALIALVSSLGSFAAAKDHKSNSNPTVSSAQQQSGCAGTQEDKKHSKKNKQQDRSEQEQEFDRVLMGIFG